MLRIANPTVVSMYCHHSSININDGFSIKGYTENRYFEFDSYSFNDKIYCIQSVYYPTQTAFFFSETFSYLKEVFCIARFSSDLNKYWVSASSTRKYAQKNINIITVSRTNIKPQKDIFTLHSRWIHKIEAIRNKTLCILLHLVSKQWESFERKLQANTACLSNLISNM